MKGLEFIGGNWVAEECLCKWCQKSQHCIKASGMRDICLKGGRTINCCCKYFIESKVEKCPCHLAR